MAIAFSAAANTTSALQASWTHTCGSSDTFLFVALHVFSGTPTVTYNGVSMTLGPTTGQIRTFYLFSPSAGANTVAISGGTSTDSVSASYTGTVTSALDATGTDAQGGGTGSHTASLTTIADNCWVIMAYTLDAPSTLNAGAGTVQRAFASQSRSIAIFDNNSAKTPAGSVTLEATVGSAGSGSRWGKLSIAPAASNNSNFLMLL